MTSLYEISNFTPVAVNGVANSINTTDLGSKKSRNFLNQTGLQAIGALFYFPPLPRY